MTSIWGRYSRALVVPRGPIPLMFKSWPRTASMFGVLTPLLPQNPLEKVGSEDPHLFQCLSRLEGRLDINNRQFPARKL